MTYSSRTFLLGPDDTLFRLASAKFSRMVDDPEHHRVERFAEQGCAWSRRSWRFLSENPARLLGLSTKCSDSMPEVDWTGAPSSAKTSRLWNSVSRVIASAGRRRLADLAE